MEDYEKMGVFYLGKEYDLEEKEVTDDLVLYKSKDLTTHGVIIGMTGSGKTGLGISLIEEAAMDNIPVIAIDPKGDIGNLKLTFPDLKAEDFRPWVNGRDAEKEGFTPDEYAEKQAQIWKQGLEEWGQDGKRIENLRNKVEINIYTPGSSSGLNVSVLRSFDPPSDEVKKNKEAYSDRIQITTTSLLSLVGISEDSLTSKEHVLIANILEYYWDKDMSIDLPILIEAIQNPPISKIGVMNLDNFYPSKNRFDLAILFNNLLASPSFKSWLEGQPLNIKNFLYTVDGKPKISIFSIAHLSESERMFFVTMLLNEILSWVRTQPGTSSLRALLYMDEIYGYLPPTANPPSKTPLLTLLKQARAYGLGLLLSTQNPVDLDYKALSNCGTWFIGRLQTARDKDRVLDGLEGALAGSDFNKKRIGEILSGLGSRMFYLHNVHQDQPIIFSTRWTMSYLAGPLTSRQIESLTPDKESIEIGVAKPEKETITSQTKDQALENVNVDEESSQLPTRPQVPPEIKQVYLPIRGNGDDIIYVPTVIGGGQVFYDSKKYNVSETVDYILATSIKDGPLPVDWSDSQILDIDLDDLENEPVKGATYGDLPSAASNPKNYKQWEKLFTQYIRTDLPLKLYRSPLLKEYSKAGENERDFRIRIQHLAHEKRDEELDKLKDKYNSKEKNLEEKLRKALQQIEKRSTQSSQKKVDAAVSLGSAVLGALFGRKVASRANINKAASALKSTNRAMKSGESISQAQENVESLEIQLEELQAELQKEIEKISNKYDIEDEELETVNIRTTKANITVHLLGLAWEPLE